MKRIFTLIIALSCSLFAMAQTEEGDEKEQSMNDLLEMSLEELMDVQVSISTKSSMSIRETPGIVSVITEEQIRNSGARDMVDLIQRYVPGFAFASATATLGVIGLGSRGIWSYEGKVLVLIDGMEANELKFGSTLFGNNYTLENIERIEVIRGPGSAVYGGYASMGVINIITKQVKESNGGDASWLVSHTGKSFTHNNLSFGSRYKNNDFKMAFNGVYGNGSRSDKNYTDFHGNSRSLSGVSELDINEAGINTEYKGFQLGCRVRKYNTKTIDMFDTLWSEEPIDNDFSDWLMKASYKFKIGEFLKLTPVLEYKNQNPWQANVYYPHKNLVYFSNLTTEKTIGGLSLNFEKGIVDIIAGGDYSYETLKHPKYYQREEVFKNDTSVHKLKYNSMAGYLQVIVNTQFVNVTAGGRMDYSTMFGQAFSPRIALTKAFELFHIKASYSHAFRAPGGILPNRLPNLNDKLSAEKSKAIEFEIGAKLPFSSYFTVNTFDYGVENLLTYYQIPGETYGGYINSGKQKSRGVEAILKHSSKKIQGEINFAYYQRVASDGDAKFTTPLNTNAFIVFSPIRLNTYLTWHITDKMLITPSYSFFGKRSVLSGYNSSTKTNTYKNIKPESIINLYFSIKDILTEGLSLGVGINNILNTDYKYYVATAGDHGAIPGLDRSYHVRISYKFNNSKN